MTEKTPKGLLLDIPPAKIEQNPENPRLIFHEDEMRQLLESIREQNIRVPITVYEEKQKYVLLDGERRWRCAKKLNLPTVPAIVLPKPSQLDNLLMMFNIHNVRVDWDLMPMAKKMGTVVELLTKQRKDTSPKALAAFTGVPRPTVQRALDLLELPKKYQDMLMKEAEKPRAEQTIKPDLFIETYKSMRAVKKYTPEVFDKVSEADFVDAMVEKYTGGVVKNVVSYRDVSRMARAERAGSDKKVAAKEIIKLVKKKEYTISDAYDASVKADYDRRDILTATDSLRKSIKKYSARYPMDAELTEALRGLSSAIVSAIGQ